MTAASDPLTTARCACTHLVDLHGTDGCSECACVGLPSFALRSSGALAGVVQAWAEDSGLLVRAATHLDPTSPDPVGLTFPMFRAGLLALAAALRDASPPRDLATPNA